MPSRERRPRRTRHVARILIALVAVLGIASVVAATAPGPSPLPPMGVVNGAVGVPKTPLPTASATIAAVLPTPSPLAVIRPAAPSELDGYQWPLAHARITLPFGPTPWGSRLVEGKQFHDGVDMATFCGDRIVAAHSGIVLAAGRKFDQEIGWIGSLSRYTARLDAKHLWTTLPIVVVTDDGDGYRSIYAHFSKVVVKTGQSVRAGDLIGYEGRTGRASGCHLHYGLFSPLETARIAIEPSVAKHMELPGYQIARIDPLLVLPRRPGTTVVPKAAPSPSPKPVVHP